jgi:hypothetical protein
LFLQKYRLAKYLPESPADGKVYPHLARLNFIMMFEVLLITTYLSEILFSFVGSKEDKKDMGENLSTVDSEP